MEDGFSGHQYDVIIQPNPRKVKKKIKYGVKPVKKSPIPVILPRNTPTAARYFPLVTLPRDRKLLGLITSFMVPLLVIGAMLDEINFSRGVFWVLTKCSCMVLRLYEPGVKRIQHINGVLRLLYTVLHK